MINHEQLKQQTRATKSVLKGINTALHQLREVRGTPPAPLSPQLKHERRQLIESKQAFQLVRRDQKQLWRQYYQGR